MRGGRNWDGDERGRIEVAETPGTEEELGGHIIPGPIE